jgi:hypothetical protein
MDRLGKIALMLVAAQLTDAAVDNNSQLPPDPTMQDKVQLAENLEVWEVFRIFYHALQKAVADDTPQVGWPAPDLKLDLGGLLGQLGPLLSNPAVSQLLGGLTKTAAAVQAPAPPAPTQTLP